MDETRRKIILAFTSGMLGGAGVMRADQALNQPSAAAETAAATTTLTGTIPDSNTTTTDTTTEPTTEPTTTSTTTETETETTSTTTETTTATTTETTTATSTTTTATTTQTTTVTTTTKAPTEIKVSSDASRTNDGTEDETLHIKATATNVGGTAARTRLECLIYKELGGDGLSLGANTADRLEPDESWRTQWSYSGDDIDEYNDYEIKVRTWERD